MRTALIALVLSSTLAGCGGMNRAVGVLPNTLEDLEQKSASASAPDPR